MALTNRRISIRTKLFLVITLIPALALTFFLVQSLKTFEDDKIAYVFESSLSLSKTRALQVRSEINSLQGALSNLVYSLQSDQKSLSRSGDLQLESDTRILGFELWRKKVREAVLSPLFRKYKVSFQEFKPPSEMNAPLNAPIQPKMRFETIQVKDKIYFSVSSIFTQEGDVFIARIIVTGSELIQAFTEVTANSSFLVNEYGQVLLAPLNYDETKSEFKPSIAFSRIQNQISDSGILEINSSSKMSYLMSYAKLKTVGLTVVSAVKRQTAMSATETLIRQAAWLFCVLLLATIILSFLAAKHFTQALDKLFKATKQVGKGDFGVKVMIHSKDEIGDLADSFNKMSEEVARLLIEASLKARMEAELNTAKTVQETLFPPAHASLGPVEISGFYEPASECGGDWWHYSENEQCVSVFIGDVTGHGVPAALMTSAAHAACFVAGRTNHLSPSQYLSIINDALFSAARGKMMMTFFVAQIDKSTGMLTYSIASHEPPMLIKAGGASHEECIYLNEINNKRLGEADGSIFSEAEIQLNRGDRLFIYTDGVSDVESPDGKSLGERRLRKMLSRAFEESLQSRTALESLVQQINEWRLDTALKDDVTAVIVKFDHIATTASSAA